MKRILNSVLLIGLLVAPLVMAKVVGPITVDKPSIEGRKDWVYLSNFWYDTSGKGSLTVTYKTTSSSLYLSLYNQEEWNLVQNVKDCDQRLNDYDTVQPAIPMPSDSSKTSNRTSTIHVDFPKTASPTWWHVALVDCQRKTVEGTQYGLTFLNRQFEFLIQQDQFGFDNQHMFEMFSLSLILLLVILFVHSYGAFVSGVPYTKLVRRVLLVFRVALFCEVLFHIGAILHIVSYSENGKGSFISLVIGLLADFVGYKLLVVFYIMILKEKEEWKPKSRGWAIFVAVYILLDLSASVALYMQYFDIHYATANLDHPYSTFSGIARAALQIIPFSYYMKLVVEAKPINHSLSTAQNVLFAMGGIWLLSVPLIAAISLILPAYYQWKMMIGCYLASNFVVLSTVAFFLHPTRANRSFESNYSSDDDLRHALGNDFDYAHILNDVDGDIPGDI